MWFIERDLTKSLIITRPPFKQICSKDFLWGISGCPSSNVIRKWKWNENVEFSCWSEPVNWRRLNLFSSSAESLWGGTQVRAGKFGTSGGTGNVYTEYAFSCFLILVSCYLFVCYYSTFIVCCSGYWEGRSQRGLDGGKLRADMELAEGTEPGEQMKEKYMQANY